MRLSDGSSDVCSSDLLAFKWFVEEKIIWTSAVTTGADTATTKAISGLRDAASGEIQPPWLSPHVPMRRGSMRGSLFRLRAAAIASSASNVKSPPAFFVPEARSEEHTSELQSLMRNSYAVFC